MATDGRYKHRLSRRTGSIRAKTADQAEDPGQLNARDGDLRSVASAIIHYRLWVGRMDPIKGPHRAIEAARLAGRALVLAGPVQPGQEDYFRELVEPHIDGHRVRYIGEVRGTAKLELFANAAGLLMPVRWREPFGMVMVEALTCGTPVIAFPEGAPAEIVIDTENGFRVAERLPWRRR
jgi:glycosyltransferase involved in cell wall biosynthesis